MKRFIKHIIYFSSLFFACAFFISSGFCNEEQGNKITHKKIAENTYELSVILTGTSNPADGQELLIPIAKQLCGSDEFRLGKYTFKSLRGTENSNKDELVFSQEVYCGEQALANKPEHKPDPNWQPSDQVKQEAVDILDVYIQAVNQGKYSDAYKMLTSGMQNLSTEIEWTQYQEEFKKISGGEALYTNVRVTWYKNPEGASALGIYAAFDIECEYKNINFCDEVIILHKENFDHFRVMRHERNYIDKKTEEEIKQKKQQEMDEENAI